MAGRRSTRGCPRPDGHMLATRGASTWKTTACSTVSRSESKAAVRAVDMGGRSSLSAGPTLLHVSEKKKKVCSTVNVGPLPNVSGCRREELLQLQENIVERKISKGTDVKKNHARTPPRDLRRVNACGAPLLSSSAGEPSQPSWSNNGVESVRTEKKTHQVRRSPGDLGSMTSP